VKKIVVLSDTHIEKFLLPENLLHHIQSSDTVVHAGDFDKYQVFQRLNDICKLYAVAGDSDDEVIKNELPTEITFKVENLRFGVVHKGNYLNEFDDLGYKAMELGVNVLIFGHIHRFVVKEIGDVLLLCPGSPTKPRLSTGSFVEVLVDEDRMKVKCHFIQEIFCGIEVMRRFKDNKNRIEEVKNEGIHS
jgi:hypothetical protein